MKKIRLAIVRQKYRPDGGAERFISRALEALDDDNLELNILTRQWSGEPRPDWHIHICNPPRWGRVSRERGFADAARRCWQREAFDLVQSHERIAGCDVFRAGDGAHRAWLEQRARIIPSFQRWTTALSGYHRYVLAAEKAMFHSPALKKIICNSAMVMNDIIHWYQVPADKFALIYNAIDATRFYPATQEQRVLSRRQLSLPEQAGILITVGSGFERKGLRQAIAAVAATDRYLIVVGQDKHAAAYQNYARTLGCAERIRFVGVQTEVLPFYHAADGLILPTLYDPFPNVILEAMACGLPIITSASCGGAEFITQGVEGYVCDALDVKRLTEFTAAIPLRHRQPEMGQAARERVKECTPGRLSTQLTQLYQELLGR
ncbi:glycosyltransferase family 4 protein [Martelella alba]|uniref:Glycosyltransferase family 4 protein n=1 Tax=Martelella alba TaxID=2590451 RepID=A0ABY2SKY3_9HYPH|nr:glycosyltransferase family 4 protein [Martelella alba]TKI04027.1 glycosyltransferase family 4 protein [Martelella alba]